MIKNIKRILNVLKVNEIRSLILIIFLTFLVTFLEIISLGTIPIYVTFILDPEKLIIHQILIFLGLLVNSQIKIFYFFYLLR